MTGARGAVTGVRGSEKIGEGKAVTGVRGSEKIGEGKAVLYSKQRIV